MTDSAERTHQPRTRLAAYAVCVDDEGRILLCRIAAGYPAQGSWTLPGGGVRFGEDPADAVLRELTEETGLSGEISSLAFVHSTSGSRSVDPARGPWHGVRIVYEVALIGGQLRDEVDESTDRAEWFAIATARSLPLVDLAHATLDWIEER